MNKLSLIFILFLSSASLLAAPKLASPNAKVGGVFKYNLGQQPTTLNPLSSTDYYASLVQGYIIEAMADRNVDTYQWEPYLAKSWEISKDGLTYTFTIRDGVTWSDGKPFTAEDVKFTFDAIMDPDNKYKTAHSKSYFENIASCNIVGKNKVQFKAKRKYFANFDVVAGMGVVPKHIYENPDKKTKKKLNKTIVGTGPYMLDKFRRGKNITLKKNPKWWGNNDKALKGIFNFDKILMRFIKDGTISIQKMERGDLDYLSLSAEEFKIKTNGKKWGKSVFKTKIKNKAPKGYNFIGWNLKNPIFASKNVRLALYHLIDRKKMIDKFDFGLRLPATGPWYQQSIYADPKIKPISFSPKKALALLKKDGWKDSDGDGVLDKVIDGTKTKLSFTILEPNKEFTKYETVFQEDAKQAGVDVQIKVVEWNTFIKLLDERKFEAVRLGWSGGSVDYDPKQIWHSASYANKGSNFIGYSNKKVDKLIDKARETLSRDKRIPILREVYREIAKDVPYAFLFNPKFGFYGYSKRMKRVKDTYNFGVGTAYWWIQ